MDEGSREAVELLLREGWRLQDESRYAEALRVAERGVEAARQLGDLGLEVRAVGLEANQLRMLGDNPAALKGFTWILGVVEDPARRAEVERAGLEWAIANAYWTWVRTARFLPEVPTEKLLAVLDAAEDYVRRIGQPGWRAGLVQQRAQVLDDLGRTEEAIGFAEEGLALKLRDGSGPGATLAGHRWGLGDMLRQAGRPNEARTHNQAVLDDLSSGPADRMLAHRGLAHCALAAGDPTAARAHAEQAVQLAEGMGDDALSPALDALLKACRAAGDLPAARAASERYIECARRLGSTDRLYFALRGAADVALDEADAPRARALLDEAAPHAEGLDRQRGRTIFHADLAQRRKRLAALTAS